MLKKFVTDLIISYVVVFAIYFALGFVTVLIPEIREFILNPNITALSHIGSYEIVRRHTSKE